MPLIAPNIVFVPPPVPPEPKQKSIVVGGGDWRDQIAKQIEQRVMDTPQEEVTLPNPQQITVSGNDWRNQLSKQIEVDRSVVLNNDSIEPPVIPKPKKNRKKSEKLIEYKDSPFLNDMLSINKE